MTFRRYPRVTTLVNKSDHGAGSRCYRLSRTPFLPYLYPGRLAPPRRPLGLLVDEVIISILRLVLGQQKELGGDEVGGVDRVAILLVRAVADASAGAEAGPDGLQFDPKQGATHPKPSRSTRPAGRSISHGWHERAAAFISRGIIRALELPFEWCLRNCSAGSSPTGPGSDFTDR